jgi:hypothetical protein
MAQLSYVEKSLICAAAFRVMRSSPLCVAILVLIVGALLEFAR